MNQSRLALSASVFAFASIALGCFVAQATERTFVNKTGRAVVVYVRPVDGPWTSSGVIRVGGSWQVTLGPIGSKYEFRVGEPAEGEPRSLGVKEVADEGPLTVDVVARMARRAEISIDASGRSQLYTPLRLKFDFRPGRTIVDQPPASSTASTPEM